jgi:predicted SnoaL-like aldol condensation-catalyzing enzyme
MKIFPAVVAVAFLAVALADVQAQVAVVAKADQEQMLASSDPRLAANKRLVYNFWREVFEAGHMDLAEKYMAESYIQHNPNVPTGRAAFVDFFSKNVALQPIESRIQAPLVAIIAEGDMVVLAFVREGIDPKDPAKKYSTTWFDMFRIENGKIAEHWDPATKR